MMPAGSYAIAELCLQIQEEIAAIGFARWMQQELRPYQPPPYIPGLQQPAPRKPEKRKYRPARRTQLQAPPEVIAKIQQNRLNHPWLDAA